MLYFLDIGGDQRLLSKEEAKSVIYFKYIPLEEYEETKKDKKKPRIFGDFCNSLNERCQSPQIKRP